MNTADRNSTSPPDGPGGGSVTDIGSDSSRLLLLRIGELSSDVKNLTKSVDSLVDDVAQLRTKAVQLDTTWKVGGILLFAFFSLFWWMFGTHVNALVQSALREVVIQQQALPPAGTPPVEAK